MSNAVWATAADVESPGEAKMPDGMAVGEMRSPAAG